jgi:RNA polymerase sigma-70 factor (ECF subfamily)
MTPGEDGWTAFLIERLRQGHPLARNDLLDHARRRLRDKARQMLRRSRVRRWEGTDDVLQDALIRLDRLLSKVPLKSPDHFWILASRHMRHALIDLARRHAGRMGFAANKATDRDGKVGDDRDGPLASQPDESGEPDSLEDWERFHEAVGGLPEDERVVFELIWYQGLTQEEAAATLGVSLSTVRRRWLRARRLLHDRLGEGGS